MHRRSSTLALSALLLTACSDALPDAANHHDPPAGSSDTQPPAPPDTSPPAPPDKPLTEEADFIALEPFHISGPATSSDTDTTTPGARIFYVFQPADEAPEEKPLFVFFNGGPGGATSIGLLAGNTARRTLEPKHNGGVDVGPNASSWTAIGNLLYVDARQTGFSYDVIDAPSSLDARRAGFSSAMNTPFTDAADVNRVVLRFLAAHPAIRGAPVVLVGESYGGTRAAAMLHELHHPGAYETENSPYRDKALAAEIRAHFAATRPGEEITPELVSEQFGAQVLIQPAVAGLKQINMATLLFGSAGSPLAEAAERIGISCETCAEGDASCDAPAHAGMCMSALIASGRDLYDLQQTEGEGAASLLSAAKKLKTRSTLRDLIGVDPVSIPAFHSREGAYRFTDLPGHDALFPLDEAESEPIAEDLGALPAWDRYFIGLNAVVGGAEGAFGWTRDVWALVFLDDLKYVDTFITNAAFDTAILSPAIAQTLALQPTVASAVFDPTSGAGEARPGALTVTYATGETRTIRMPRYATSGHEVAKRQPTELRDDVSAWLAARGIHAGLRRKGTSRLR